MRVVLLVVVLLLQARMSWAYPTCDDVSRLRRPVTEIEITYSYSSRFGMPASESRSLSRITYSDDERTVSIATTSIKPGWKQMVECRYDKGRRLVRETTTNYDGREIVERTTTSYQYSGRVSIASSGGKKTYLYHDVNGQVIRGMARGPGRYEYEDIKYKYFDGGLEVRSLWSGFDTESEELQVFDARGNLTRYEANGGGSVVLRAYDEFDTWGNWTRQVLTLVDDGTRSAATEARRIQYR